MGALATDFDPWLNSAGQGYGGQTAVPANNPVYKPPTEDLTSLVKRSAKLVS